MPQDSFSDLGRSFIKVSVMMIGELEFDDTFVKTISKNTTSRSTTAPENPFPEVAFVFITFFLLLMCIILMNLLVCSQLERFTSLVQAAFPAVFTQVSKVIRICFGFACINTLRNCLEKLRHLIIHSEVKPKPFVARLHMCSQPLRQLRVFAWSFDWFNGLFPSYLIG